MTPSKIVGLTLLAAFVTTPAAAQEARRLKADLSVQGLYDDNVARSSDALAATRGIEQEDWILTPNLNIDILSPLGRQAVFLKGRAGYAFYEQNSKLDSARIDMEGGILRNFRGCIAALSGGYKRYQTNLEDVVLEPVKNIETVTNASADFTCARKIGLNPAVSIKKEWSDNSSAIRSQQDFENTSGTLTLSYARPTLGEFGLFGSIEETDYVNRGGAILGETGYDSTAYGLRYSRRLGAKIQATASVARTKVDAKSAGASDFEGATYTLDATYRPSSRIETHVAFSRSARPGNQVGSAYSIDEELRGDFAYELSPRLRLTLAALQTKRDFETLPAGAAVLLTDDRIRSITAGVQAKFSRRLALILEATQEERDANLLGYSYDGSRVGLTLTASY